MNMNLGVIDNKVYLLKILFMCIFTYYVSIKFTNAKTHYGNKFFLMSYSIVISCIVTFIKYKVNSFVSIISLIVLLSIFIRKSINKNMGYTMLITVVALGINYSLFFISMIFSFLLNTIIVIKNDYLNLLIMIIFQSILLVRITKIKRIKNGLSFLNKASKDEYWDMIILNISVILLFSSIIFANLNIEISKNLFIPFVIFSIIMFETIKEAIQLYYKQKLLIQDLTETKKELEEKKKEVEDLEKENLKFSMRSHSIAHKQRSLEYKLNKILQSSEMAEEIDLKDRMESIAREAYVAPVATKLTKTEVMQIDDMLDFMQAECVKDNIEFNLQVNGNIHKMVNNYVEKQDLEILLADHIKDAIIAVNHTDNINRSILVKLGEFDNCYSLNIYDSGVNFPKEILENLGKNPVTSYPNEGGTGMGYMNTFETLRKYDASLIIEEFGMPSKENFTKVVSIKFDKKNEFKIL